MLNEPGNLWWGSLPTAGDGAFVHGLILPSAFAAAFWRDRFQLQAPSPPPPIHIINPGIVVPPALPQRRLAWAAAGEVTAAGPGVAAAG